MTEAGRGELLVGTDIFGNGDWREDVSRYTPIRPLISSLWPSPYRSTLDVDPLRLPCSLELGRHDSTGNPACRS